MTTFFPTSVPASLPELEALVRAEVPESQHLEYKASPAISAASKAEIAKDCSAFANAAGGLIIYGIRERDHLPDGLDGGVEHGSYSREWLEQVVQSNVAPSIPDLGIVVVRASTTHGYYVVEIPRSTRAPHQETNSKVYYRRQNFRAMPMLHWEIEDLRSRVMAIPRLVRFSVVPQGQMVYLAVENIGSSPARDLSFRIDPPLRWYNGSPMPAFLQNGTACFEAGSRLEFFYDTFIQLLAPNSQGVSVFTVTVRYRPGAASEFVEDVFSFDLRNYSGAALRDSDELRVLKELRDVLKDGVKEIKNAVQAAQQIAGIADPTGLALSTRTMRRLTALRQGGDWIERSDPQAADTAVFMEVLGIDFNVAHRLEMYFRYRQREGGLEAISGLTAAKIAELKRYFDLETDA